MRTGVIGILDLGLGNLASVAHAVGAVGLTPRVSGEPAELEDAAGLILPGVGAFATAADRLRTTGGAHLVKRLVARGRPVLGICLGLQLMCAWGEEGGGSPGLGLIEAEVHALPRGLPVPQVGWNQVFWGEDMTLLAGLEPGAWFYFSHAYCVDGSCPPRVAGRPSRVGATRYGVPVLAALESPPLYGVQFHPEKSGVAGLKVLRAFGGVCSNTCGYGRGPGSIAGSTGRRGGVKVTLESRSKDRSWYPPRVVSGGGTEATCPARNDGRC